MFMANPFKRLLLRSNVDTHDFPPREFALVFVGITRDRLRVSTCYWDRITPLSLPDPPKHTSQLCNPSLFTYVYQETKSLLT